MNDFKESSHIDTKFCSSRSLMGKKSFESFPNSSHLKLLNDIYVFIGLVFLKSNQTTQKLVKTVRLCYLTIFKYINKMAANLRTSGTYTRVIRTPLHRSPFPPSQLPLRPPIQPPLFKGNIYYSRDRIC